MRACVCARVCVYFETYVSSCFRGCACPIPLYNPLPASPNFFPLLTVSEEAWADFMVWSAAFLGA